MTSELAGRIAVVTGGGSGIGAACCIRLAGAGAQIVVLDRDQETASRTAAETGGTAIGCDISLEQAVEDAARKIEAQTGPVDILVNCAGIVQGRSGPYDMPMRKWDDIVRIDQRGTYVTCLAFARAMLTRRRGAIVNISSAAGLRSMPLHAYGPAKAAVIAMSETLAAEWGCQGIRVNCVSPGFTLTTAMQKAIEAGHMDEAALTGASALGRLVDPGEVAEAVAFLISDRASAITGINLPVDCGWLAGSGWSAYGGLPKVTD